MNTNRLTPSDHTSRSRLRNFPRPREVGLDPYPERRTNLESPFFLMRRSPRVVKGGVLLVPWLVPLLALEQQLEGYMKLSNPGVCTHFPSHLHLLTNVSLYRLFSVWPTG